MGVNLPLFLITCNAASSRIIHPLHPSLPCNPIETLSYLTGQCVNLVKYDEVQRRGITFLSILLLRIRKDPPIAIQGRFMKGGARSQRRKG